ncbi:uncharacterized protein LOC131677867 isoform X2 [Topomyia yanbarensis]|uniref:uncharacterized protein LOC131677867 isoform X2 n=1 Tax=Topomyia yanbarensis TaxID=2498891 RepID=UPI00273B5D8B|nr:uncharacterized protein LOC131677867 isoform X2 [Topomyia yanbarensis]
MEDQTADTTQYCRLCLQRVEHSETSDPLADIFARSKPDGTTLAEQIRDCLGLYIDAGDSIRKICENCEQTINLIDEFRILCHQTDEIYESLQLQTEDKETRKQYQEHVTKLRVLVQEQRVKVNRALESEDLDVKEISVDVDQDFRPFMVKTESVEIDTEWIEDVKPASFLEIKAEYLESEEEPKEDALDDDTLCAADLQDRDATSEDESSDEQDASKSTKLPLSLKLAIAKEIKKNPGLLDISASGSILDKGWKKVAQKFGMDVPAIRRHWRRLRWQYVSARKREEQGVKKRFTKNKTYVHLNAILHSIYGDGSSNVQECPEEDEEDWLGNQDKCISLAEKVYNHPILWSIKHADFHNTERRDRIWEQIGAEMGSEMGFLKSNWKRLRDWYRSRYLRFLKKRVQSNDPSLKDPLYKILDTMLRSNMRVGARGGAQNIIKMAQATPTESDGNENSNQQDQSIAEKPYRIFDSEKRLKLAQICHSYEIIWNTRHQYYNFPGKRDSYWDQIAEQFNVTRAEIKFQWSRLRGVYRNRYLRAKRGDIASDDPLINEPLYKLLEAMLGENMLVGARGTRQTGQFKSYEQEAGMNKFRTYDNEQKMQLAEVCRNHEIIWNSQHPEYNIAVKRDAAWDQIAEHFNVTREEVKFQWCRLRNVYRCRCLRAMRGLIRKDDPILTDPLYKLLETMFSENMQVGVRSQLLSDNPVIKPSDLKSYGSIEQRVQLAEEISKHEMIWNMDHPDFHKSEKRGRLWRQIAAQFEVEPHVVRDEWKRFRDYHHAHKVRIAQGGQDETSTDTLYQALNQFLSPICEGAVNIKAEKGNSDNSRKRPLPNLSNNPTVMKRRFTGKRQYDDLGCIRIRENGSIRYHKICELCGKQVERSMFEFHMNGHNGLTPYACSFEGCDKRYGNRITRDRHEVIVHGEDGFRFECDQCGEKFKQRAKFDYHYAIKHKSEEVPCGICGKLLKHKSLIKDHERLHTSSFVCKVCGKVLQKKWSLHVHMRVHTQEKPYPCELCDQRFMLKVQMKTHLLKKHGLQLDELQSAIAALAATK